MAKQDKKKLISARARTILKVLTVIWFAMVVLLILRLGSGETTRPVPDYRPVDVRIILPQEEGDGAYPAYRKSFIETGYLAADADMEFSTPQGVRTIAKGTPIGAEQFDLLVAAGAAGPFMLLDPKPLRDFAKEGLKAAGDIASRDEKYAGTILVKEGEKLTLEKTQALIAHGWAGHEIRVGGHDKIVGVNLTLPFVAINFLFLVAVLYGLLWEPLLKILDERALKIRSDLETAENERAEADRLKTHYDRQIASINQERIVQVDRGRKEGYEERSRIVGEARAEMEKMVAAARMEVEASVQKARDELRGEIADISAAMAAEIIRREIRPQDHRAMVERFVSRLDENGSQRGESQ